MSGETDGTRFGTTEERQEIWYEKRWGPGSVHGKGDGPCDKDTRNGVI